MHLARQRPRFRIDQLAFRLQPVLDIVSVLAAAQLEELVCASRDQFL